MNPMERMTATDARHTLGEAWRVFRARRCWLIFMFLSAATAAFVGSHWLPRRYSARTLFERRNDVVLQSLIGPAWNQTFEGQRKSLTFDMAGPAALSDAIQRLDEARSWRRDEHGDLTADGLREMAALTARIAERVEIKVLESTPQRDVIEVAMNDSDASLSSRVVVALRDNYVARSRAKMLGLLEESLEYFTRESKRSGGLVRRTEERLATLEREFPGVLPDYTASVSGEINGLSFERAELRRRILELNSTEQSFVQELAGKPAERTETLPANAPAPETPQRAAIAAEIERIDRQVNDEKVLRGKTDLHPTVAALYEKLARLREDYRAAATPPAAVAQLAAATERVSESRRSHLEQQLRSTREQIAMTQERAAAIQARLDQIDARKTAGTGRRQDHIAQTEELAANRAELAAWQKQIDPIQRILDAQKRDRGVRFISVQEPGTVARPSSPDARIVLLACLAIGVAAAVLAALIVELADRSYRTPAQVGSTLGIPVIESIDEIVGAREQRRRVVMHLVALPTAAAAGLLLMATAAAGAYLSLEAPWLYEQVRLRPLRTLRAAMEHPRSLIEISAAPTTGAAPLAAAAESELEPRD